MAAAARQWLAPWRSLRGPRRFAPADAAVPLPPGTGPLLLVRATEQSRPAASQISANLGRARRDLRILSLDDADSWNDKAMAAALLDHTRPFALLLLGTDLPAGLIAAAIDRAVPVILGDTHLEPRQLGWNLAAASQRGLLRRLHALLVNDPDSYDLARRIGIDRSRLTMTGPATQIHEPLRCTEAERAAFAQLMSGRHAWLAACVPPSEEEAVIAAHHAALQQSHRALLFLVPDRADRADTLAEEIEAQGLIVARRTHDEEPEDEVQVMISDGPTEMGLWYRLAPVTYMGGTLSGDDAQTRNPFEPAALGSAIVHGPLTDRFATEWRQLDRAHAARQVANAPELASSITELSQPEIIATLASNAWAVSTGGAGVVMQIAAPVLALLQEVRP